MTKETDKLLTEAAQKVRLRMIDAVNNEVERRHRADVALIDLILAPRFNIQEVALAMGMSTSAIRRLIKAGKIEATKNPTTHAYEMSAGALFDAGLFHPDD